MKYDLNGENKGEHTIEEKYALETTNDIGDALSAESAFVII